MGCEKCWGDAYMRMMLRGGCQAAHYADLIKEREDNQCTPEQQRGDAPTEFDLEPQDG